MDYKYILYEPGSVARVKLNRPEYRNALSYTVAEELMDAFSRADADDEIEVIVFSGEGPYFSAGHDLGSEQSLAEIEQRGWNRDDRSRYLAERKYRLEVALQLRNMEKPTIGMVHGWCIFGASSLVSATDIIFASEDARFLPFQLQYFSLPWDVGPRKAKEILFEHRVISAHEAHDLGLVNRVYPREQLEQETLAFASRVAENFPDVVRGCKMAINHMMDAKGFSSEINYAFHANHITRGFGLRSERAVEAGIRGETRRERRVGRADVALEHLKIKEATEL